MIRQAPRYLLRQNGPMARSIPHHRRFLSTAPPSQRSRSLRNSTVRWGLAIGLLYWYNTSDLFAEEASFPISNPPSPSEETALPTLDDIARSRQKPSSPPLPPTSSPEPPSQSTTATLSPENDLTSTNPSNPLATTAEESSQQGAFNEETGEINWECPCLGGMAHGPCGEPFRAAFSCFVFSQEDPKGMECIDKFTGMQECFREHPEIYGKDFEEEEEEMDGELAEGGEEVPGAKGDQGGAVAVARTGAEGQGQGEGRSGGVMSEIKNEARDMEEKVKEKVAKTEDRLGGLNEKVEEKVDDVRERAKQAKKQVERDHGEPLSESDGIVPKAAHDAR